MGRRPDRPKRVAGGRGAGGRGSGGGGSRGAAPPRRAPEKGGGRPTGGGSGSRQRGLGGDQVEGRQAVRELLLAGRRRTFELLVSAGEDGRLDGPLADLVELADDLRVPVQRVARTKLDAQARTDAPQGVIARAEPLPETELDELAVTPSAEGGPPFLVAVDGVTDPGNLGALLRSAECAGVSGIVLPRHRAAHVTPTVTKAAAGAIEHLPIAVVGGLPAALEQLKASGLWIVGLDAGGDTALHEIPFAADPVVLVLGAEGAGLSRLVRQRCDAVASIPLRGVLGSLNVAAAAAIATYEIARSRGSGPGAETREP